MLVVTHTHGLLGVVCGNGDEALAGKVDYTSRERNDLVETIQWEREWW